jgi:hypothetical protein
LAAVALDNIAVTSGHGEVGEGSDEATTPAMIRGREINSAICAGVPNDKSNTSKALQRKKSDGKKSKANATQRIVLDCSSKCEVSTEPAGQPQFSLGAA